jgi:hypothetical protein
MTRVTMLIFVVLLMTANAMAQPLPQPKVRPLLMALDWR